MNHRVFRENRIPLREIKPPLRKNIRKLPKPESYIKRSAGSTRTFPETLSKALYEENSPCGRTTPSILGESILISPLKEILEGSAEKVATKKRQVLSEPIYMEDEQEEGVVYEFKMFNEKDVPFFSQGITKVELSEPGCDNDCQTDDEQIRSAINFVEKEIADTLANYKEKRKEVGNIKKYEIDRVLAAKKHRV